MRKLLSMLLAMILILGVGMFTAAAERSEKDKLKIAQGTMSLEVLAAIPDAEKTEKDELKIIQGEMSLDVLAAMPDAGAGKNSRRVSRGNSRQVSGGNSRQATGGNSQPVSGDFVLSGRDINIGKGKYSYLFRLSPNGTLVFDNDLTREYQGVNGKYQLHYDINEANQHTMIVTGEFDHIITASPLLEKISAEKKKRILSNVSDDSYFYQLVLKTEEILTFRNNLRFRYDSDQHGYSIEYQYDIAADKQNVKFSASDATKQAIKKALTNATEYLKSLLPDN